MKKRIKNWVKKKLSKPEPQWPRPRYDETLQPHFLFIITPPYSGSTALAELITSSNKVMSFTEKSEGQWLVPGLCHTDRWNPEKIVDYSSVKAVWLNAYQEAAAQRPEIEIVVEKSPPNMVRLDTLSAQFDKVSFLANNRNPYANCASILARHHEDSVGQENRKAVVQKVANDWITRSTIVKKYVTEKSTPLLTYEALCERPASIIAKLALPANVLSTINVDATVKVKDYPEQPISNQNERQIAKLPAADLDVISATLAGSEDLLSFFDYSIR